MKKYEPIYHVTELGSDTMPIGAYCSPQPACASEGVKYPSKLTARHYRLLADLGVNLVYGHAEAIGRNDALVFEALAHCHATGIFYLVRDLIAEEYVSLGHRQLPDYRTMSKSAQRDLDRRFEVSLMRYKNEPSFAGVSFFDEPGSDSFQGIAAAKAVFERVCPDKLFYVNMLPNNIAAEQLQYGACQDGVPKSDVPQFDVRHGNAARYDYFLKRYVETVQPQVFSYDTYPFMTLGGVESMIHTSLYELMQFGRALELDNRIPFWPFLQIGGKWEGSATRVTDFAELSLSINLALAYGAKGIQLFPACFPNDWLHDPVPRAGVFDRYGKPTDHYHYLKVILHQLKKCQTSLMHAHSGGLILSGTYAGMLPSEEEMQNIPWNETIYRGTLPDYRADMYDAYRELTSVCASAQVLVGCFDSPEGSLFYVVNNSIVTAADITLSFDRRYRLEVTEQGETMQHVGTTFTRKRVLAGGGFLVKILEVLD